MQSSPHTFHIPVMGLAYTIDSPVKVARYGISSVISIVEDRLVEMMRNYYYQQINEEYIAIPGKEENAREKRITDYLNLINKIVSAQIEKVRQSAFEAGSEIVKYFELLPDDSRLKQLYTKMAGTNNPAEKEELQTQLRKNVTAGSIDVNIMTKLDKNNYHKNGELIEDGSDAITALRGYANSDLTNSAIIFSAGMNPRLFNYMEKMDAFNMNEAGDFDKRVVIKVSDYRSALIQGKYLAKKGIWVSEFRIESGLNCGGHAFATDGYLLGPILEEFKTKKEELTISLFELYKNALLSKQANIPLEAPAIHITVQGGIGTHEENDFLLNHYNVKSTGWGSPFLLVPEATTVDDPTLTLLKDSQKDDLCLSHSSPLGVRFHYLKGTTAEKERFNRISNGKPGSPCTEKYLVTNTEFTTEPICTASAKYQTLKLNQLQTLGLPENKLAAERKKVLDKECLCVNLSNAASLSYETPFLKNLTAVTVCPGPNIAYFSQVVSLRKMVGHIYGRTDLLKGVARPNLFINELAIYIAYLKEELDNEDTGTLDKKRLKYYAGFYQQLITGINYYRQLCDNTTLLSVETKEAFKPGLDEAEEQLNELISHLALNS